MSALGTQLNNTWRYIGALLIGISLLIACGGGEEGEGSKTEAASPLGMKKVPRTRTLIADCVDAGTCNGQMRDYDTFNPFIPGRTSRTGYQFLYEPLYFYNAYRERDNLIPWIATGHEFNEDYTEVVVEIRPGVEWSDGTPWTAHDFVFTINMLRANAPVLLFSTDMKNWVREAVAVDDLTARIALTAPNPRFVFTYFTHNFDNGVPIMPKHIWEGKDPETFTNFDMAKDWPVVSGPYRLVLSEPQQRVWDLREEWWANKIGFRELPRVERVIFLPYVEETKRVQMLLANDMDICTDLRPPNIRSIVEENRNVTTWSGREPPLGYLDWWPISLGFNNLERPFSDPEIRWAINHAINREQIVEIGWQGNGKYSLLPFPEFPPLRRFTDQLQDLLQKYPVGEYNPAKTAEILTRKGWVRNSRGLWKKDGQTLKIVINIFGGSQDYGPVVVAQLKQAGFDASFRMLADVYDQISQGKAIAFFNGHAGSVRDPYFTLRLYHSRFVRPTGTPAEHFWRWRNEAFDAIVDQMGQTAPDDPELVELFRQAMEIWLRELPSIPLLQWFHRIPHNETYWQSWPTAENPYINSAPWHRTFLLVLLGLEPAQS